MDVIKKTKLQMFAAPDNMIGKADITVKAREIDFVSSFAKNMQAILDIMGIARMIPKANGTQLKKKTASGTLESGTVGEGEEVPLSKFKVTETPFDTITIDKYAKAVSIEAIAEHGYEAAVSMTDEEFRSQLRDVVMNKMYSYLLSGTLTSTESTWQMAVAMSVGMVKNKFQELHRDATSIVAWVNVLDLYKYFGNAGITVQTAFGLDYIKNFMGIDTVFLTSEIPQGTVVATPVNNMIGYYVDPSNSEFSQADLTYTTDPDVGIIGYHIKGDYDHNISKSYAIMGIRVFAEYQDAIAVITVDDTPDLGTLSVNSVAGTATGDTKITVSPAKEKETNVYKYKTAETTAPTVLYGQSVKNWTAWDGTSDITATTGHKITVVEADATYKALNAGEATVTSKA